MNDATRLQSFLADAPATWATIVDDDAFRFVFHPDDALMYLNYALPRVPVNAPTVDSAWDGIVSMFGLRERHVRFEFVDGFAPRLATALEAHGLREEAASVAMLCRPEDLTIPDVDVELAFDDGSGTDEQIAATLRVRDEAFGLRREVFAPAIERHRIDARRGAFAVARRNGETVGVGALSALAHGLAEIAGIGVAESERRRGLGAAITAFLTREAFARGAERAYLTAGSAEAARVYERIGFRRAPFRVRAFHLPPAPEFIPADVPGGT